MKLSKSLKMGVRGVNALLEKSSLFGECIGIVKPFSKGGFLVGLATPPYIYSTFWALL